MFFTWVLEPVTAVSLVLSLELPTSLVETEVLSLTWLCTVLSLTFDVLVLSETALVLSDVETDVVSELLLCTAALSEVERLSETTFEVDSLALSEADVDPATEADVDSEVESEVLSVSEVLVPSIVTVSALANSSF
ncbi:hypothetical protein R7892_00750 [Ligilactobacillus murinus]|uniref:hypothetical protein n=1 Tax=Ligilactobacillus murinus TaxID=1622 RepID=UPI00296B21C3|nr:hypothetical protein [Ligilactobacillus murinus]WOY89312.1 hypothetical protein R7892_00750 [Ligilactobacillus murinus]